MQESIKASSSWFLACAMHAAGMAAMILHRAQQLTGFEQQLHLIFLVNDIFFTGCVFCQTVHLLCTFLSAFCQALRNEPAACGGCHIIFLVKDECSRCRSSSS